MFLKEGNRIEESVSVVRVILIPFVIGSGILIHVVRMVLGLFVFDQRLKGAKWKIEIVSKD